MCDPLVAVPVLAVSFCIAKASAEMRSASLKEPHGVGVSPGVPRMTIGVDTDRLSSSSGDDINEPEFLEDVRPSTDLLLKLRYKLPRRAAVSAGGADPPRVSIGSRFLLFQRSDCSRLFHVDDDVSLLLASLDDDGERRQ